jgi:uncharacterized membrane protein
MNVRKALRIALLVEWGLIIATIATSFLLESALPSPLRQYVQAESERDLTPADLAVAIGGILIVAMTVVATIGLFLFQRWARPLYLVTTLASFGVVLLAGASVEHAVSETLGELAVLVSGVILGIIYFTNSLEPQRSDSPR